MCKDIKAKASGCFSCTRTLPTGSLMGVWACMCMALFARVGLCACMHVQRMRVLARAAYVCARMSVHPMRWASACPPPQSAPNACMLPAVCMPVTYRLQSTAGGARGAPTPSGGACTRQSGCTCAACAGAEEALTAPGIVQDIIVVQDCDPHCVLRLMALREVSRFLFV